MLNGKEYGGFQGVFAGSHNVDRSRSRRDGRRSLIGKSAFPVQSPSPSFHRILSFMARRPILVPSSSYPVLLIIGHEIGHELLEGFVALRKAHKSINSMESTKMVFKKCLNGFRMLELEGEVVRDTRRDETLDLFFETTVDVYHLLWFVLEKMRIIGQFSSAWL